MYSAEIVERNLHALRKTGVKYKRRTPAECWETAEKLAKVVDKPKGRLHRAFLPEEHEFMASEALLCRVDFRYFAERYGNIQRDPQFGEGGIGPITFWESQERALRLIAKREEEVAAEHAAHNFSEGILTVWHKARQLGATAMMRQICMHRMIFYTNTRLIAASTDEDKVHKLYTRDHIILDNLPFYLRPSLKFDTKDQHLTLDSGSQMLYQQANQRSGIGTGDQYDVFHFTELGLWEYAERLEFDFFPAIPKSRYTFGGMESTGNGRGNFWHEFSESVRNREPGFERWTYIFAPYYIEPRKYSRIAPDDWRPSAVTQQHAGMVEKTSPDVIGTTYRLTRNQMYFWETEREMYRRGGTLHLFFTSYCATPEESFQHTNNAALPVETLEWMRASSSIPGMPYIVNTTSSPSDEHLEPKGPFPGIVRIGSVGSFERMDLDEYDKDARGIFWMWEPPSRGATYCISCDPAQGRTGWTRYDRMREDRKTDNGAIIVLKIGKNGENDVQVGEYAAPVDAFDLGDVANLIGRMYAGTEEDQCRCILEVYPGPGGLTLQRMLEKGYTNFWRPEMYSNTVAQHHSSVIFGWHASPQAVRDLWSKASRYIQLKRVVVRSSWCVEEYANCRMDPIKRWADDPNGHDDRVRAMNLALWCANGWSMNVERTVEPVKRDTPIVEWSHTDMSYDEIMAEWSNALDRLQ